MVLPGCCAVPNTAWHMFSPMNTYPYAARTAVVAMRLSFGSASVSRRAVTSSPNRTTRLSPLHSEKTGPSV